MNEGNRDDEALGFLFFLFTLREQPGELNTAPLTWLNQREGKEATSQKKGKERREQEMGSVSFVQHCNLS